MFSRTWITPLLPLVLAVAATGATASRSFAQTGAQDGPQADVWFVGTSDFSRGQYATVEYSADSGSYVTLVRFDTYGRMYLLAPWVTNSRSTNSGAAATPYSFRTGYQNGIGYVAAIVSWEPLDLRSFGADADGMVPIQQYGSLAPYDAADEFASEALPPGAPYSVEFAAYSVGTSPISGQADVYGAYDMYVPPQLWYSDCYSPWSAGYSSGLCGGSAYGYSPFYAGYYGAGYYGAGYYGGAPTVRQCANGTIVSVLSACSPARPGIPVSRISRPTRHRTPWPTRSHFMSLRPHSALLQTKVPVSPTSQATQQNTTVEPVAAGGGGGGGGGSLPLGGLMPAAGFVGGMGGGAPANGSQSAPQGGSQGSSVSGTSTSGLSVPRRSTLSPGVGSQSSQTPTSNGQSTPQNPPNPGQYHRMHSMHHMHTAHPNAGTPNQHPQTPPQSRPQPQVQRQSPPPHMAPPPRTAPPPHMAPPPRIEVQRAPPPPPPPPAQTQRTR